MILNVFAIVLIEIGAHTYYLSSLPSFLRKKAEGEVLTNNDEITKTLLVKKGFCLKNMVISDL